MINPPIYFLNVFYFVEEPCVERNIRPHTYMELDSVSPLITIALTGKVLLISFIHYTHSAIFSEHFFPFLKIGYKNSIIIRFDPTFFIYLI